MIDKSVDVWVEVLRLKELTHKMKGLKSCTPSTGEMRELWRLKYTRTCLIYRRLTDHG